MLERGFPEEQVRKELYWPKGKEPTGESIDGTGPTQSEKPARRAASSVDAEASAEVANATITRPGRKSVKRKRMRSPRCRSRGVPSRSSHPRRTPPSHTAGSTPRGTDRSTSRARLPFQGGSVTTDRPGDPRRNDHAVASAVAEAVELLRRDVHGCRPPMAGIRVERPDRPGLDGGRPIRRGEAVVVPSQPSGADSEKTNRSVRVQRSPMPPPHRADREFRIAAEDRAGLDRLEGRRRLWRARVRHGGGGRGDDRRVRTEAHGRNDRVRRVDVGRCAPRRDDDDHHEPHVIDHDDGQVGTLTGPEAEAVGKAPQLVGSIVGVRRAGGRAGGSDHRYAVRRSSVDDVIRPLPSRPPTRARRWPSPDRRRLVRRSGAVPCSGHRHRDRRRRRPSSSPGGPPRHHGPRPPARPPIRTRPSRPARRTRPGREWRVDDVRPRIELARPG